MTNLLSSANKLGNNVTQIITSVSGVKKTIHGIKTETIEQGQFTKFETVDGRLVFIYDKNIFCIEVFKEKEVGAVNKVNEPRSPVRKTYIKTLRKTGKRR